MEQALWHQRAGRPLRRKLRGVLLTTQSASASAGIASASSPEAHRAAGRRKRARRCLAAAQAGEWCLLAGALPDRNTMQPRGTT